jgi:predicted nuclease of predicted toxin-antitoxin system
VKILIDMNLSPDWADFFRGEGFDAIHWSAVGDGRAKDPVLMAWARAHGYVIFTHDLDFGILLALTRARGPSIIQVRTQDVMSTELRSLLSTALRVHEQALNRGAILTIDLVRARIKLLPILPD